MFIENAFPNVFPRHLAAGHTHLFTRKSLDYILKKYNFKIIGEWWFGADISDLLRSISLSSKKNNETLYKKYFQDYILDLADELQTTLDKNKLCSEVHLVLSKE
jgi:ABC-type transport system substrate-binding protein